MPRIPVRTSPYHTLPRCTRHYKSKRDLVIKSLGKSCFINGSQFIVAWISPKGEVDAFASEMLQPALWDDPAAGKTGILNRAEFEKQAVRIKSEVNNRWEEIRQLEERGEAPQMSDDDGPGLEEDEEEAEDETSVPQSPSIEVVDPDQTMVDDGELDIKLLINDEPTSIKRSASTIPSVSGSIPVTSTRARTPSRKTKSKKKHTMTFKSEDLDEYYIGRFSAIQQATCKLVVKNWIKIIEPKKQVKCPYNKGEDVRPSWWPESIRHREPDHLSKSERLVLLTAIVRSPLIKVARLELSTAEAGCYISTPRQGILREVYMVAKEEERRRNQKGWNGDITVHLPFTPIRACDVTPDRGEKRAAPEVANKENVYATSAQANMANFAAAADDEMDKRPKLQQRPSLAQIPSYDNGQAYASYPFATQNQNLGIPNVDGWRDQSVAPIHMPMYSQEQWTSAPPTEYARSPMPELDMHAQVMGHARYHPSHLAPILTHGHMGGSTTPIDSPQFGSGSNQMSYFPRSNAGPSYMQQQQMDYMAQHAQHQHQQSQQHQSHQQQAQPHQQDIQQQLLPSSQSQQQSSTYDFGGPYLGDWTDQAYTNAPP